MRNQQPVTPKLFIGIDIHKRSWKVHCASDISSGKTFSMKPDPIKLKAYIEQHFNGHEVSTAYEAGCCGYYAHRAFVGYGWHSLVVNPADIHRKGKEKFTKTDHIDAQIIARELKDGRLQSIHVPDMEREQLRSLFRRRNNLVKNYRKIKSLIKGQLLNQGVSIPCEFDNSHWSHNFRDWLDNLEFAYLPARMTLESHMRYFRFVDQELRDVSTQLRRYCKEHYKKDYILLRSIPGIGGIVACGIICELGDLRRFNNIKRLSGYVGLAPGIHQSGDNLRNTGITRRAHRLMRSYFIEASWQAIRTDPVMQAYYRKHLGKNVKAVIVKIARKLLSRTLAVIKTEIPYEIGVVS
jgi:transposase